MSYLLLAGGLVVVAAGVALLASRLRVDRRGGVRRHGSAMAVVAMALLGLTAVFDHLMIAAGLYRYDPERLLGLHVGLAPIEDFSYPLAAALLLPSLWSLYGRRRRWLTGLRTLLTASRPLSWVNTAFPFAAAYLLGGGRVDATLIIGSLYFLVPYNLAMYGINDVFDHDSDLLNPRKGGAQGALIDRSQHRMVLSAVLVVNAPFIAALLLLGGPPTWAWLAGSLFAVVAYSWPGLRFKERPFLDSLTSGVHFVSPAAYGLVLAGAGFGMVSTALLLAFLLWAMASHAFGAVQDIEPDRAAGIRSIATELGARRTVGLALASWLTAGLALLLAAPWPATMAAALVLPYLWMAAPYRDLADADGALANRGWRHFLWLNYVVGFLVTMLMIWWALAPA